MQNYNACVGAKRGPHGENKSLTQIS